MNSQGVIGDSRLLHLRELKTELAKVKAENARLRDENAMLAAHLDLAITAAEELKELPAGGRLVFLDGWNLILGAKKEAHGREELLAQARAHLAAHPADFVWIVYDGPRESSKTEGRLRVSYTGGAGAHRADRFICDFLRMARFRGLLDRVEVRTHDKDFRREVERICANC